MNLRKYKEDDAKEINLCVFTNNEGALRCYKSVGFKVMKVEKNAYQFYSENWECAEMSLER